MFRPFQYPGRSRDGKQVDFIIENFGRIDQIPVFLESTDLALELNLSERMNNNFHVPERLAINFRVGEIEYVSFCISLAVAKKHQRARDGVIKRNGHVEIQFGAGAMDFGQVDILRALRLDGLDDDFGCRLAPVPDGGNAAGELRGGDDFIRTDVV